FLSGESGQGTIRLIRTDGLDRVAELESTDLRFYQFLPLYDVVHLGGVVTRGHAPTSGEMTWAVVDGGFVVLDALSLAALQPEAAAAAEAARAEMKAAAKGAVRSVGRDLAEQAGAIAARRAAVEGGEAAAQRAARWWAVRAAGGTYQV